MYVYRNYKNQPIPSFSFVLKQRCSIHSYSYIWTIVTQQRNRILSILHLILNQCWQCNDSWSSVTLLEKDNSLKSLTCWICVCRKYEAKAHIKTDLNGTQNEGSSGASEITALQKREMLKTKFKRERGSRYLSKL